MRILGVDPGQKSIGIALSDPTGIIATPLTVIQHVSRQIDAAAIAKMAIENKVGLIVVGQTLDMDGNPNLSGRQAARLAGAIRVQTEIPVKLWDEGYSTRDAKQIRAKLGAGSDKRRGHLDDLAAAVILQSYLDVHQNTD
jgi:putative Holliday junction resolvase